MALLTAYEAFRIYGCPLQVKDASGAVITEKIHACDPETGEIHCFVDDKPQKSAGLEPNHVYFAPAPLTITPIQP